jgi:hypothetical protein
MKEYGIRSSTLYDIQKQKDELLKFSSTTETTKAFSIGWLAGFKTQHGIRKLDISGEKKSSVH